MNVERMAAYYKTLLNKLVFVFLGCFVIAILLSVLMGVSGVNEATSVMLVKIGIIAFMMVIIAMSLYWIADGVISFCRHDTSSAVFLFAIGAAGISFAILQILLQLTNDDALSSLGSQEAEQIVAANRLPAES